MTTLDLKQIQISSAIDLFSKGEINQALDAVQGLLKDYPNEPVLFNIKGACYADLGQLDVAVTNYKEAITIKPDYAKAHFNLAGSLHDLGQLETAVQSYQKAIEIDASYAEAYNNLGNVYQELKQVDSAVQNYKRALEIKPDYVAAQYSLGNTFMELGQLEEAVKSYKAALKLKPDFAGAYNKLGNVFKDLEQIDSAVKSYKKALEIKPDYVAAQYSLGIMFQDLGQFEAAIKCYEMVLAIKPDFEEAHNNLGVAFLNLNQFDEAVKSYKAAIKIKPDFVEAINNLGIGFFNLSQMEDAIKCYEKAIAIQPGFVKAHNNLGNALMESELLEEAVKSYKIALKLEPEFVEAINNLGITFYKLHQLDDAMSWYERALVFDPGFADAHNNIGAVFLELGQFDEAVKSYKAALKLKPDFVEAINNLGITFFKLHQLDDAIRCYERAITIKPDYVDAHANLATALKDLKRFDEVMAIYDSEVILNSKLDFIFGEVLHTKMLLCIWDDLPIRLNELTKKINNREMVVSPFPLLALIDDPEIQRKTAEIYADKHYPQNYSLPKIGVYSRHSKIRIGYFSADFKKHPVASLTAELYELHDRSQFEIHAFSFGPNTNDEMNLRIKAGVDHFHDVHPLPYRDIAMLARSLEVDIAVDLGGFTKDSRTEVFAISAAPIQISYIGYLGTMGATYYDYLIADQVMIPENKQKYYSEKIVYLPSYQVNNSKEPLPEIVFTRKDLGLPETGFVFCCFNNSYKFTPTTFDSWARILKKVDGSVLLIFADNDKAKKNLTKEIILRGIQPNRIIFGKRMAKLEYLARYQVADLFLDTLPYNAGATASDALRMGLPVLTCLGNSLVSRMGASLLNAVNLPELVKSTQKEYELFAIELAMNPEKLKIIKNKLASNLPSALLYDTPLFTRHLESAYLAMYDRYQKGQNSDHIYVEH
jgi:protein O-GlcNAc transferase